MSGQNPSSKLGSSAEVVHELSSCLAQTAEQQQLLHDAARLLTHGEVISSHMLPRLF